MKIQDFWVEGPEKVGVGEELCEFTSLELDFGGWEKNLSDQNNVVPTGHPTSLNSPCHSLLHSCPHSPQAPGLLFFTPSHSQVSLYLEVELFLSWVRATGGPPIISFCSTLFQCNNEMPRNLSLVFIHQPMVKLVSCYFKSHAYPQHDCTPGPFRYPHLGTELAGWGSLISTVCRICSPSVGTW